MYTIIFSLTAHENIECLYDLIDNIKKCFIHYNIIILLSLTKSLEFLFDKNKYIFVKIVTSRDDSLELWGNINLFQQHILNIKYLCDNSITYDFFWFVASNEMFINIVPPNFLDNNIFKIIKEKNKFDDIHYDIYYNNLKETTHKWIWTDLIKKDDNFMNYLYKNKFVIYSLQHEGIVLPYNIVLEIFNEYTSNHLFENSTFKKYVMEEIFITTYILNKYKIDRNITNFCLFTYGFSKFDYNTIDYNTIKPHLKNTHLSIKPVLCNYNNNMRKLIRDKIQQKSSYQYNNTKLLKTKLLKLRVTKEIMGMKKKKNNILL
jgi:hypothetical protein